MGVDPVNSSGYNTNPTGSTGWGKGDMPPGIPLKPDDPWCKCLRSIFPHLPESEIEAYASRFRDNMFQMIQEQMKRDAKKAKEASDRLKKVARGDE